MPFIVLDPSTAATAPATTAGTPLTSYGMTLADFRAETLADLQGRTDVTAAGNTRLDRWINWGYLNIAQMLDLKELWASVAFSAVASQPFYLVPPALSWVKRLMLQDTNDFPFRGGRELEMMDEPTYRNLPETSAAFGSLNPIWPESYFRWARMLVLWPTPSTSFTLACDFRVRPLSLVNPTDSPILPPEYHEAIQYAALQRAWRSLRNPQASADAGNEVIRILRSLRDTDAEETAAMHVTLTPVTSRSQLYNRRSP